MVGKELIKDNVKRELEKFQALADGVREGLGMESRIKWRTVLKDAIGKGSARTEREGSIEGPRARLKKRLSNENRLSFQTGSFLQGIKEKFSPQPKEPSPAELEQKRQLEEEARRQELKLQQEAEEKQKREALQRARESISIGDV